MPPNNELQSETILNSSVEPVVVEPPAKLEEYKPRLIWLNIISISLFHLIALYTVIFDLYKFRLISIIYGYIVGQIGGFGVTGGAHRLWAHRSYKAKWPLRVILLICYSVAGQNTVYDWVRDHRVHHKFSETDADPHNSNRGFFFAHVGWLMQRKHPEVLRKGAQVDMSDILADPLVTFHTKHFTLIKIVFCFILPTLIPIYCWGEDPRLMIQGMVFVRYVMGLNFTWLVNSAAHIYGNKPYDKRIKPSQNLSVSLVAMGEGWHNYHHVFPWDYKAAELGNYRANFTTFFIDMFAKIGWAYDLKTASPSMVERVITKHGDGTHPTHEHPHPE
ncbi:acyl-CoA Delta-9 desaturase-like [Homalodisca vitripennis]|uniref:acyl-CoA Delta-9 desaturase-like n=1 Tax=Homalodisca vitripennis TaxID=197043 RepID=UPI001EEA46D0|nr:acyl-CoA Delta-9 desaturase-like [Homalodisca vitripennis]